MAACSLPDHLALDLPELTLFDQDLYSFSLMTSLTPVKPSSSPVKKSSFRHHIPTAVRGLVLPEEQKPELPCGATRPPPPQAVTKPRPHPRPIKTEPPTPTAAPSYLSLLQAAILADCRHQPALPFTLFSPASVDAHPTSVSVRRASLEAHFAAVRPRVSGPHLDELLGFYHQQTAAIESERRGSLRATQPTPWLHPTVHGYYDHRLVQLVARVEASLGLLHAQCAAHHQYNANMTLSHATTTPAPLNHATTTPRPLNFAMTTPACSQTTSGPSHHVTTSSLPHHVKTTSGRPHTSQRLVGRRAASQLGVVAIKVMTRWYEQNMEHPYPGPDAAEVMATAGGITVDQVRKWFSNKRRRSGNTRTLGQIAATRHRGRQMLAEAVLMAGARASLD